MINVYSGNGAETCFLCSLDHLKDACGIEWQLGSSLIDFEALWLFWLLSSIKVTPEKIKKVGSIRKRIFSKTGTCK